MRIYKTLKDLAPGTQYAISFASTNGEYDSEWSQAQTITTTSDVMPPAPVNNLAWYNSGDAFTSQWDKVTTNTDGSPLKDFRHYRVTVTDGTTLRDYYVLGEKFEFTKAENLDLFGTLKTSITITVRCVDLTYNESAPRSVTASPANPPTPSKPIIRKTVGLLNVEWDGLTSTGVNMPNNFAYIEVHASTTSNFTPTDATNVTAVTLEGRRAVIDNLTYGTTYYIRFVAVNTIRKKSGASVQESGTPTRISGLDIENGQIGVAQINFTAFDIGGANGYYQTSQPTTGMKNGDLWYDTDDGYTVYRYNGTTWVLAPEVGQISGTKILAGTVTANAIGTNQIIASSANIATAAIDSANIASLKADKIDAGSLNAEVTITGRLATSLTGARTEINSQGIFKFDSSGNILVAIDGTRALLTGTFMTATTGRRIQIGAGGTTGALEYYAPDGKRGLIRGFTQANGVEALQMSLSPDNTAVDPNNYININSDRYSSYRAFKHEFVAKDFFRVLLAQTGATDIETVTERYSITPDGAHNFRGPTGASRYNISADGTHTWRHTNGTGSLFLPANGSFNFYHPTASGYGFFYGTDGVFNIQTADRGSLQVRTNNVGTDVGGVFSLFAPNGYGAGIRVAANAGSQQLDIVNPESTVWFSLRASQFLVQSDAESKSEPLTVSRSDMLDEVLGLRVRRYKRKNISDKEGNVLMNEREEVGFVAQETSERIDYHDKKSGHFVDIYQTLALTVGAVQALHRDFQEYKEAHP